MRKGLPRLNKEIKVQQIYKEMSDADLAKAANLSREYTNAIINGRIKSPPAMRAICDVLDIVYDEDNPDDL